MYVKIIEPRRIRVLLSGGLDSTVCLAWAVQKFGADAVEALSILYGQRHRKEVAAAKSIARTLQVPWALVEIPTLGDSGLTTSVGLPLTGKHAVVPGRNRGLLEVAAALVLAPMHPWQSLVPTDLVFGACRDDWELFHDCRPDFFAEIQRGWPQGPTLHTPLLERTKTEIIALAHELGAASLLPTTWSCYLGGEEPCGTCLACTTRAAGFAGAETTRAKSHPMIP